MKKIRLSNKGFTLIELLTVIIIIGILMGVSITAVMYFVNRARDEQKSSQEKTISMAAQNYLQENRSQLPKSIGDTTIIPVSILKDNNYLTEDLKNSSGKSCMTKSYASVYKKSNTKYIYKGHLYCGNEQVPATETAVTPTIKINFVDAAGKKLDASDSSILEKVSEAKFTIEFGGGTKNGEKVAIDGYSYSVLVKTKNDTKLREVYSSGTLSANRATNIFVDRDNNLKDYIDVSSKTTIAIKAVVRNVDGGINDKVEFIGEDKEQAEVSYQDKTPPKCVVDQTIGEAVATDWIGINTPIKERKITVVCDDGSGSGCIRSTFTKTWSEGDTAEYANIQIKDNAGNTTNCKVRVNIDMQYPVITLDAYAKGTGNSSTGSSVLTGTKTTANSANATAIINSNEYKNLVGGYMNSAKYPNGVIYKVNLSDNISIKNWKWEVNAEGIKTTTDSRYEKVGTSGDAKTGSCTDQKTCSFNISFVGSGLRKGVLTVYDKANNAATYTIYANVNRVAPAAPTIINSSTGNSTGTWTKSGVTLTLSSSDTLSTIADYYYSYDNSATAFSSNDEDAYTKWVKLAGGTGRESFTTTAWTKERNDTTYVKVCNVAGNCSASSKTQIMIDKSGPTAPVVTGYKKTSSGDLSNVNTIKSLNTIASNTWHKGWIVTLAEGSTDAGVGGVYYLVTVTGASTNTTNAKQNYRNVNENGTSTIKYKACDKLGNCSAETTYTAKLDRVSPTKPSISNPYAGKWTGTDVKLKLGSTDEHSGIGDYYYTYSATASEYTTDGNYSGTKWVKLNGGTGKTSFTTEAWNRTINATVYIQSCDAVGNCSEVNSTVIKIDKTAPNEFTLKNSNTNWTKVGIKLTITGKDQHSGMGDYYYKVGSSGSWHKFSAGVNKTSFTYTWTTATDGTVYVKACDKVDNCTSSKSTTIHIDHTAPKCTVTYSNQNTTSGVTLKATCSDSGSGCRSGTQTVSSVKATLNKNKTVTFTVYDNVGNKGTCKGTVTAYQKCDGCLYNNGLYTGTGCSWELGSQYYGWKSCEQTGCKEKTKICGITTHNNTSMGCCYYKCNCKTYHKKA